MQNPLEAYRRAQRDLRRHFDSFTRENCPTCPTPCCVRPARIVPADILLAESTGWRSRLASAEGSKALAKEPDMVEEAAGRVMQALGDSPGRHASAMHTDHESKQEDEEAVAKPCEFLGGTGCTFPSDLRPFGCTTYLCKYMYERLDRQELARIKRQVKELEQKHIELMRALRSSGRMSRGTDNEQREL